MAQPSVVKIEVGVIDLGGSTVWPENLSLRVMIDSMPQALDTLFMRAATYGPVAGLRTTRLQDRIPS